MSNTQNTSDLIYLLIDNEATSYERQSLFHELADQPELQAEFQEALTAKIAIERDVASSRIPHELEASLFQKAGIPLIPRPTLFSKIVAFVSGKTFLSVSSFLFGCFLTFFMMNTSTPDSKANTPNDKINTTNAQNDIAHTSSAEITNVGSKGVKPSLPPSANQHGFHIAGLARTIIGSGSYSDNHETTDNSDISIAGNNPTNSDYEKTLTSKHTEQHSAAGNAITRSEIVKVGETNASIAALPSSHNQSFNIYPTEPMSIGFIPYEFLNHLSVEMNGLQSIRLFPYRSAGETGNQFFKNACVALKYNIDEHHAIGLMGGAETFPMFIPEGDGLSAKPSMAWFGATYQYTADRVFGYFLPFGKVFVGGNDYGTMLKSELGLAWQPDKKVRFVVALDGTQFFYVFKDTWHGAQKLGLKYGIEVFF